MAHSHDQDIRKVCLIVPCYHPAEGWAIRLANRVDALIQSYPAYSFQLILVNDGTPGGLSPEEIQFLYCRMPTLLYLDSPVNSGKGHALRRGIVAASGDLFMYTDVDIPYTNASMIAVLDELSHRRGVVAGERFSDYYDEVPAFRRLLSKGHRTLMRSLFRLPISDSQAGLKGFDQQGRKVFLETTVDRFLVDLDFIARCRGRVSVTPVRVQLRPDVIFTDFGLAILRTEARNFLKILLRSWRP